MQPPAGEISEGSISMLWLHQYFHHIPADEDGDAYAEQYMYAYILRPIGGTLFPNRIGRYIHMMFLLLLEYFATAGGYS